MNFENAGPFILFAVYILFFLLKRAFGKKPDKSEKNKSLAQGGLFALIKRELIKAKNEAEAKHKVEANAPEAKHEDDPWAKYKSDVTTEPKTRYESETKYEPEAKYESKAKYEPEAKYKSEAKYESKAKYESEVKYESKARYETESEQDKSITHTSAELLPSDLLPPGWSKDLQEELSNKEIRQVQKNDYAKKPRREKTRLKKSGVVYASVTELKKAVILSEILAKPIGLRVTQK